MEFDITQIDKKKLIQALFIFSEPLNLGKVEYDVRQSRGENVIGLTLLECENILADFNELELGCLRILDYYKGKPMKLVFEKKRNGRVLVDTDSYDARNGKYRFLESLLNFFLIEEILITKKSYRQFIFVDTPMHLIRTKEQEESFKILLKNTLEIKNDLGKYWIIDETKTSYTPEYLNGILS